MVKISSEKPYMGAVAGEITDTYSGNVFVSDDLAGVDRISYADKAEPITYAQLLLFNGLPDEMRSLTLSFCAESKELKRNSFDYGDSFSADIAPKLPEKDGYYAVWDITDLSDLRFDTVVTAEYIPYVTAVYSDAKRKDGQPVFPAEGDFEKTAAFSAEKLELGENEKPKKGTTVEIWKIKNSANNAEMSKLHYLAEDEKNIGVYVRKNGKWKRLETSRFGRYTFFELNGSEAEIAIVKKGFEPLLLLIPAGFALICVSVFLIFRQRKKRAPRQSP